MKNLILIIIAVLSINQSNAQFTWHQIPTGVTNKLNVIDFPTPEVGYIGGNDTLLLKSTDFGQTWQPVNFTGVTILAGGEHILDLQFITNDIGYMVVGPYGGTYKTIDGGSSWNLVSTQGNLCFQHSVFFFGEDDGFIGGSGCFEGELINIITTGGASQAGTSGNGNGSGGQEIVDFDFLNSDFGLAASSSGRVYRTFDGGANWDSIPTILPQGVAVTSIEIINDSLAYAGYDNLGGSWGLLITNDSGSTWQYDGSSSLFSYPAHYDIIETSSKHILVGCEGGNQGNGLIMHHNGQAWWNSYYFDHPIYGMDTYSDSTVWAVGDSGLVVVNVMPSILSVESKKEEASIIVYPNPTEDVIYFDLPTEDFTKGAKIEVFDNTGKLVLQQNSNHGALNVAYFSTGQYTLVITGNRTRKTAPFIKK